MGITEGLLPVASRYSVWRENITKQHFIEDGVSQDAT